MGVFQEMIAGGLGALRQAAGVSIVIRRGGAESATIVAAVRQTDFVENASEGVAAASRFRTYLIGIADYAFEGTPDEPRSGDRIVQTINGSEQEYEVTDDPGWEFSDNGQSQYAVATTQVK